MPHCGRILNLTLDNNPISLRSLLIVLIFIVSVVGCGSSNAGQRSSAPPTTERSQTTNERTATVQRSSSKPQRLVSSNDRRKFRRLLDKLGAEGSLAVADLSGKAPERIGNLPKPYAWSTIKTVIVAQLLLDSGGPQSLTNSQRNLARLAITASDNGAATKLYQSLKAKHGGNKGAAKAMTSLLRNAHDLDTVVSTRGRGGFSTYGQTKWKPEAQVRFLSALSRRCLLDKKSTDYLLGLMRKVVAGQSWGIGSLPGDPPFKGGWGPDPDGRYLIRQFGIVKNRTNSKTYALAIAVRPHDGAFNTGVAQLGRIAKWARGDIKAQRSRQNCTQ